MVVLSLASAADDLIDTWYKITTNSGSMSKGDRMPREPSPRTTTCSKGHVHPSWNTTGILRIAKCESVCGFCQKETKTAANLRKVHTTTLEVPGSNADEEKARRDSYQERRAESDNRWRVKWERQIVSSTFRVWASLI
jgi:hypothetical protein